MPAFDRPRQRPSPRRLRRMQLPQVRVDDGGSATGSAQVALGEQLVVGDHHRPAGDAEVGGERPRGRQRVPGGQHGGADQVAELVGQLPGQGCAGVPVQPQRQGDFSARSHAASLLVQQSLVILDLVMYQ